MSINTAYKILVALPAYNEEQSIGEVLGEIKDLYPHYDVVVINDGSQDSTGQIAKEKGVMVIGHNGNLGYTTAIQTGRGYALKNGYDFLVFIDADGQHRPKDISRILEPLLAGDADQVRGSRGLGKSDWKESLRFRIPRFICSILVSIKMGKIVTDVTSGFKAENRATFEYFSRVCEAGRKLHLSNVNDIEEHLIAAKAGFTLMEVPVVMRHRQGNPTNYYYKPKRLIRFPIDLIRVFLRNL